VLAAILFLCVAVTAPLAQAATFKIATVSPDGSSWMRLIRAGADEIATRTEGRVAFKFYPGGVMGDDSAVVRKIRFGQLQGAALTTGALQAFYTDVQIYNMPMLFDSYAEVDAVRAELDPVLLTGMEEAGWVLFGFGEAGFAYAMSQDRAESVEDARSQKVWVPSDDPGALTAVQGFGIQPVPLSIADVLTGLQTELIDAVAVPPVGALALQWYTQVSYLLELPLMYIYGALAIDAKQFGRIEEADQAVVREVMTRQFAEISAVNRRDHEGAMEALRTQGIEFVKPTGPALDSWRQSAVSARQRMVDDGAVSDALYARVRELLEAVRSAR
jgi:TRAP-type C4-dicarboxylate transport system substrate-binding protein